MIQSIDILCTASAAGALIGAGSYIYGYIIKAKGNRQLHTASLLFSGFGLANLPLLLRSGAQGPGAFNGAVLVVFLLLGMICQAATAFRGRKSDRPAEKPRAESIEEVAPIDQRRSA